MARRTVPEYDHPREVVAQVRLCMEQLRKHPKAGSALIAEKVERLCKVLLDDGGLAPVKSEDQEREERYDERAAGRDEERERWVKRLGPLHISLKDEFDQIAKDGEF